ncbi:SMP-30/gluconolactonase/LRE family protein [Pseudomonas sp. CF161]|uniref:SMP-30/gluconolactonase/LRE family protein n=1 Tax=Pseudomonas sp. CF161 TaxID=911241 RepID=UPI0003550FCB|nr:SMP-30/gluconolactonase/LRE family protein [Pseudomonas sp. CF161]EPL09829.1 SMP-30/gluconolaconase/LRE domain-containing protein [Pseudomonas sp. CF161]
MPEPLIVRRVAKAQADLGESPVWDEQRQILYFVDISGGRIHRLEAGGTLATLYRSAARIGALALTDRGNLIFTEDTAVAILDSRSLAPVQRSAALGGPASWRFNDGACDPQGRFISGLMDEDHSPDSGKLLRYDRQLDASLLHQPLGLPNGLVWSEDGRQLFFVDSVARRIYQAPYAADEGGLGPVSVFAQTPAHLGRPDGLAIDREGGIWVCQFNGGCLLHYDRHGALTRVLAMPVPRPTSCCFGGPDLRTLFITSARFAMSAEELARYPESGDLFAIDGLVAGCPRHRFQQG